MTMTTCYTIADTTTDAISADLGLDVSKVRFATEAEADAALESLESTGTDVSDLTVRELRCSDLLGGEAFDRLIAEVGEAHGVEAAGEGAMGEWTEIPAVPWDALMERLGAAFGVEAESGYSRTGRDIGRIYLAAFNEALASA
jgi:hypothetical protein